MNPLDIETEKRLLELRDLLDHREAERLAPGATLSASALRRHREERSGHRQEFALDGDRILHSRAYTRYIDKTQVFYMVRNDHITHRVLHVQLVSKIARTIGRFLGLNEDLIEAICLAHDLGHPPFGHTGETTLNNLMQDHGGYDHQKQTYRIITELEQRYPDHPGLNLTYEVREGVVKHDTSYDVVDAQAYHPEQRGTLECQLSNLADEIAYNTSDLDDGLRAGILKPQAALELDLSHRVVASLGLPAPVDLTDELTRHRFIRRLVGIEVSDALAATAARLQAQAVSSLKDLRNLPDNVACYSAELDAENRELKSFLYTNFYRHYRVVRMASKADRILRRLFASFVAEPEQLPIDTQRRVEGQPADLQRVVCDYIAGMTDRFAVLEYKRLFDPEERV